MKHWRCQPGRRRNRDVIGKIERGTGARTAVVAPSRHANAVCAMLATVRDAALFEEIRRAGLVWRAGRECYPWVRFWTLVAVIQTISADESAPSHLRCSCEFP